MSKPEKVVSSNSEDKKLFNLDYNKLKKLIMASCIDDPNEPLKFSINFNKLELAIDNNNMGICLVKNGLRSKYINQDTIILLSQQYNGDRLKWFDQHKQYTALLFIRKDTMDERARKIVLQLKNIREGEQLAIDKVKLLAELTANYPCFIANIVAYSSNDPEKIGRNSYTINIRANLLERQAEDYAYQAEDIGG